MMVNLRLSNLLFLTAFIIKHQVFSKVHHQTWKVDQQLVGFIRNWLIWLNWPFPRKTGTPPLKHLGWDGLQVAAFNENTQTQRNQKSGMKLKLGTCYLFSSHLWFETGEFLSNIHLKLFFIQFETQISWDENWTSETTSLTPYFCLRFELALFWTLGSGRSGSNSAHLLWFWLAPVLPLWTLLV